MTSGPLDGTTTRSRSGYVRRTVNTPRFGE
jgi:hypothetical protein